MFGKESRVEGLPGIRVSQGVLETGSQEGLILSTVRRCDNGGVRGTSRMTQGLKQGCVSRKWGLPRVQLTGTDGAGSLARVKSETPIAQPRGRVNGLGYTSLGFGGRLWTEEIQLQSSVY